MAWLVLVLSGVLESGWALSLKASEGFTRLWPSVSFLVLNILSMVGLAWALRSLPVGPAYAVWTGLGAALTAAIGMVWLNEGVSVLKLVSLVLIVAGIIGLNLSTTAESSQAVGSQHGSIAAERASPTEHDLGGPANPSDHANSGEYADPSQPEA